MRVKQQKNDKVNSFAFSCDLRQNDRLKSILQLFRIGEICICIYGSDKAAPETVKTKMRIRNFASLSAAGAGNDFALRTTSDELSELLSVIGYFDELVIWSPCPAWEAFVEDMNRPAPFFTFRKTGKRENMGFYLRFDASQSDEVEIISDLSFNNSASVTKEDILGILR